MVGVAVGEGSEGGKNDFLALGIDGWIEEAVPVHVVPPAVLSVDEAAGVFLAIGFSLFHAFHGGARWGVPLNVFGHLHGVVGLTLGVEDYGISHGHRQVAEILDAGVLEVDFLRDVAQVDLCPGARGSEGQGEAQGRFKKTFFSHGISV